MSRNTVANLDIDLQNWYKVLMQQNAQPSVWQGSTWAFLGVYDIGFVFHR